MILEIDAGNTRLKWRVKGDGQTPDTVASGYVLAATEIDAMLRDFASQLNDSAMPAVKRVRVANVRGADFAERLGVFFQDLWQLEPEFAIVEKQRAGVTNSYANVSNMGVDRWLAMLAAHARTGGACGILDCGSAMTFDWLDASGLHRGGYIVPGIQVMLESLVRKSPALAVSPESGVPEPGTSTADAIGNGLLAMTLGFADHCHRIGTAGEERIEWFLTGGDAGKLSPCLSWPHTVVSDLVLDGLALALP